MGLAAAALARGSVDPDACCEQVPVLELLGNAGEVVLSGDESVFVRFSQAGPCVVNLEHTLDEAAREGMPTVP